LAKAIEILNDELPSATQKMAALRDHLERSLIDNFGAQVNGKDAPRVANTSNIAFPGFDGENLLLQLDMAGVAVSHGSACASGALEPSRVLLNMGLPKKLAASSLRFSLSRFTSKEEIERTIEIISSLINMKSFV
jgi:cysteine desulfurase